LKSCLTIASFALSNIKVNGNIMEDSRYENVYSVEEVNRKVLQGVPFRDAYRQVGESISKGDFHPDKNIHHTHEGSIGNLCLRQIQDKMETVLQSFNFHKAEMAFQRLLSDDGLNQ
jgi:argininosuccinate lyase